MATQINDDELLDIVHTLDAASSATWFGLASIQSEYASRHNLNYDAIRDLERKRILDGPRIARLAATGAIKPVRRPGHTPLWFLPR